MSNETIIANTKNDARISKRKIAVSDLLPHSFQFAEALTKTPADFSFDELNEEFKPDHLENKREGRYLLVFSDMSSLEFFHGHNQIKAHDAPALARVLSCDSRLWPVVEH